MQCGKLRHARHAIVGHKVRMVRHVFSQSNSLLRGGLPRKRVVRLIWLGRSSPLFPSISRVFRGVSPLQVLIAPRARSPTGAMKAAPRQREGEWSRGRATGARPITGPIDPV